MQSTGVGYDFKNLRVWRAARDFSLSCYRVTSHFPREELYGITSQIRSAAVSIAANIAESCGRPGTGDQARMLQIAMGSAREVESHLEIAAGVKMLQSAEHEQLTHELNEIQRMLAGLIARKRERIKRDKGITG